jgi:mRNA interferase MazF
MLRGEVRMVNLDPTLGSEAAKTRPAVIVSNDALNTVTMALERGVVTVAPITSNVKRVYPFQVLVSPGVSGLSVASKIQAEQIRAVSVSRIGARLGHITAEENERLDIAMRLHLDL